MLRLVLKKCLTFVQYYHILSTKLLYFLMILLNFLTILIPKRLGIKSA